MHVELVGGPFDGKTFTTDEDLGPTITETHRVPGFRASNGVEIQGYEVECVYALYDIERSDGLLPKSATYRFQENADVR